MKAEIQTVWLFESTSTDGKVYQTLLYVDGTLSCDCPGWTRRVINGKRSCKHVRFVEMGVADSHAKARKDYTAAGLRSGAPVSIPTGRKFDFQ